MSFPHTFLLIKLIKYMPGVLKVKPKLLEPHVAGLPEGFAFPRLPEVVHPIAGETNQLIGEILEHTPLLVTSIPAVEVLVKVSTELTHATESGEMVNFALGLIFVVIGSSVRLENPHGFSARIFMKKVFGVVPPVAPHEELVNVWLNEGGGGFGSVTGGVPSFVVII